MIYLYSKIYKNSNRDYIYANRNTYSVIKDGIKITEQPTLDTAVGYRNVLFTNKAVNWLTDTFGEAVDSTELFYSLTGYLFPTDTAALMQATQIGYKKCRQAKVLIYFDMFLDKDDSEFRNFLAEFLSNNNKDNVFLYSQLQDNTDLQDKVKEILSMEKDISLDVLDYKFNMDIGDIDTIKIKSSHKFRVEFDYDGQTNVKDNPIIAVSPKQDEYSKDITELQFEAIGAGQISVRIVSENSFTEKSVGWDLVVSDPNQGVVDTYTKAEIDEKFKAVNESIAEITKKYDDIVAKMTTLEARIEALENAGVAP